MSLFVLLIPGTPFPQPCPNGTYQSEIGKVADTDCVACDPGYYCLTTGSANVTDLCDPGYYCSSGAAISNPTGKKFYQLFLGWEESSVG